MQAGKCKAKVLEAVKTASSKWTRFVARCKATLSKWYIRFFPLEECFDKYEREMHDRRIRALNNLKTNSWETFVVLLNSQLDKIQHNQLFKERYRVEEINLKKEFDKAVELQLKGRKSPFLSSIKGNSLKSISIYEVTSPVFGVGKFEYNSGENASQGIYTLDGGALTFSQTVTGGLFVYFSYPKSEGLFGNKDKGLVFRLFDNISEVTAGDLDKSLRLFFRLNNEMTLYGKVSRGGRVILWWIKLRNGGDKWGALESLVLEVLKKASKFLT